MGIISGSILGATSAQRRVALAQLVSVLPQELVRADERVTILRHRGDRLQDLCVNHSLMLRKLLSQPLTI